MEGIANMTDAQRFELISRYVEAADDVIGSHRTPDLELVRMLLRAALSEAGKGRLITAPQATPHANQT